MIVIFGLKKFKVFENVRLTYFCFMMLLLKCCKAVIVFNGADFFGFRML